MNKLLQVLVCGLAAISFSATADDKKDAKTDVKVEKKGKAATGGTKSDAKASAETKTEAAPAPAPAPVETEKK